MCIARHNVIEVKFAAVKNFAAVLAGILVAFEHIMPGKFDFLLWKPIENQKHNHAGNTDLERNCRDQFMIRRVCRQIAPALEIVRHEIVRLILRNNVGVSGVNQREGAPRRADIHRLPETVEHQDLTV